MFFDTDQKPAAAPSSPQQAAAAPGGWFGGILGGIQKTADAAVDYARDAWNPTPAQAEEKQNSITHLFGNFADSALNAAGFGGLRVAEAKEAEREAARAEARAKAPKELRDEADAKYEYDHSSYERDKKKPGFKGTEPKRVDDKEIERRVHGKMIDYEYKDNADIQKVDPEQPVGKLDTPEARASFLNSFVQNDPNDPKSAHMCGPTALVAAAIVADGPKGLSPMISSMEKDAAHLTEEQKKQLTDIKDKIKNNTDLKAGDIQFMQKQLYEQLQRNQTDNKNKDYPNEADRDKADHNAINSKTMERYLKDNPAISKMFRDKDMNLNLVDNSGKGTPAHWVLEMRNLYDAKWGAPKTKAYYDPWARKDGQLVTDEKQRGDYKDTTNWRYDSNGQFITPS